MGRYRIGDEIICAFNLGDAREAWYQEFKLQVIGFVTGDDYDSDRMLCYVPQYMTIRSSFTLGRRHQESFGFPSKFIGEQGIFADDNQVVKHMPGLPGEVCSKCKMLIQYATCSASYLCWTCRDNPYR